MNIPVPDQFNFDNPESWDVWRKRFERYLTVGGFKEKPEPEKIDILMYVMGPKSETILLQMKDKPDTVTKALDCFSKYFAPRTNVIFERFRFNTRKQNAGEPVETFITDLHTIAEKCKFGDLKDELIRDRIVVGLEDNRASEVMQLKDDLTLEKAIEIAKQSERQQYENRIFRKNEPAPFNYVNSSVNEHRNKQEQRTKSSENSKCFFCGQVYHKRDKCPAKNAICNGCGKGGHYQRVCKSLSLPNNKANSNKNKQSDNQIHNVNVDRENDGPNENNFNENPDMFIGHIQCCDALKTHDWILECYINEFNSSIKFLVDTGASNASLPFELVPKRFHDKLNTNYSASGPDGTPLNVVGSFQLTISYNGHSATCLVYVIKNLKIPLLGREAISLLNILQPPVKIPSVNNTICLHDQNSYNVALHYPSIFKEIGEFKGFVSIKLKSNAKPYVQSVPRPVPVPYMNKLKTEINRLLRLKIIEPMQDVTDWVAPIVVVPKNDQEIRLCVDYTKLNEYVKRPYYPIPKIESTLTNLKGYPEYH